MPNFDKHKNFHANKTEPHILCDMHTHSENSHDSACPISDMAEAQIKKGTAVFAVTDHYDGCYFDSRDIFSDIKNSVKDIDRNIKKFDGQIEILKGIELGEPAWSPEDAAKALELADFDVVVCATNAVCPIIDAQAAKESAKARAGKAQFLIDLGLPRNIAEDADSENTYLYRLEDLSKIANENMELRKADIEIAEQEIKRKAQYLADRIFGAEK